MTDLLVDRLRVQAAVTGPDDEARVRSLLTDLTQRRLEEAMADVRLPVGDWCLRRLDVALWLDARCGDVALGRRWARAVAAAVVAAAADGDAEVVHFPRAADAVTDLVAGLALGDDGRHWAWRAVGALTATDPDPTASPGRAALAALGRDPASCVHVLSAAVRRAGLPAVHRLLGVAGWQEVAAVVLTAAGQAPDRWLTRAPGTDGTGQEGARDEPASAGGEAFAAARPVAASILARSPLAQVWRDSRLRPDRTCARAWAVLAAAEAEPALFARTSAAAVLALLPSVVAGTAAPAGPATAADAPTVTPRDQTRPPDDHDRPIGPVESDADRATGPVPVAGAPATYDGRPHPSPAAPTLPAGDDSPEAPGRCVPAPDEPGPPARVPHPREPSPVPPAAPATGRRTAWGGLAYLLATAPEAGIPDELLADEALADRPPSWVLFHLARRLCAAATAGGPGVDDRPGTTDDPAVRAMAGLPPTGPAPEGEPTVVQRERLDHHARRWAAATAARLGADEDPRQVLARITARVGTVQAVPGWVEFRLRLDDVDLAVRRCGLDVDPGFVPWLGAVVVIRYD